MRNTNQREVKKVFYSCVSKPLFVFRIIGLLPIEGLLNTDGNKTRFNIKSLYTIYYGTVLCMQAMTILLMYYCALHKEDTVLKKPSELILAATCLLLCISLFHLSKTWTPSLRRIEYLETLLPPLRSRKILLRRIKWYISIMFLLCLANFLAHTLFSILVNHCLLLEDDSGWYLKSYFLTTDHWYYHHMAFSYASGFMNMIIKLQAVILYYVADILIVVVTGYLTCRVKQFYGSLVHEIKRKDGKEVPWYELRAQFTRLSALVTTVDDLISPFIATSFLSHLLFICNQLYNIVNKNRPSHMLLRNDCELRLRTCHPVSTVVYSLSLGTMFLRSLMVSLTTARLHTLGREPLNALHYVPTSMYNHEMQRLMDQVYHTKIGLSGLRFFYITRGTVLSMISTILTYELVLLQIRV